jgi:hypothetical protein
MKVTLKLSSGKTITSLFDANSITIGRSNKCDFAVPDEALSRNHALVEFQNGNYFVTDLGSSNGVYVDGTKIGQNVRTAFNTFQQLSIASLECQIEETAESETPLKLDSQNSSPRIDSSNRAPTPSENAKPIKKHVSQKSSSKPVNNASKLIPVLVLVLAGGVYFYFSESSEKLKDNKSASEQLISSNVPEGLRSIKDEFNHDYMVIYASNSCEKEADSCKEMKLSTANGEGIVIEGKEAFVFIAPETHLEDKDFAKIKNLPDANEIVALYLLLSSSLMTQFQNKTLAQVHLILLNNQLVQTKSFRFHTKYFAGNEIVRMFSELGEALDNGANSDAFWKYSGPLISTKLL